MERTSATKSAADRLRLAPVIVPECDTKERNLSAVVSFYQQIFQEAGFWKTEKMEPNQISEVNGQVKK